jgi:aspartyl-tRNA(Asn)/glutamyl-tRNA(Gln) amidotransferase subunit C
VSITLDEVRHIAALARLGIDDAQAAAMARELGSILDHMQVIQQADLEVAPVAVNEADNAMELRPDVGPPIPLARAPNDFAPAFRDGFFLVPRLATHEDLDSAS